MRDEVTKFVYIAILALGSLLLLIRMPHSYPPGTERVPFIGEIYFLLLGGRGGLECPSFNSCFLCNVN